MPALPEKIRSGLVELRTNTGSVYVMPSVAQRIYLLWTFRNFHRLPRQVLNRHQQRLIERLAQTAIVTVKTPIAVIGTVENVILPARPPEAAPPKKVLNMSVGAELASRRAVGAGRPVTRLKSSVPKIVELLRKREYLQPPALKLVRAEKKDRQAGKNTPAISYTRPWGTLAGAGVALCALGVIASLIHFRQSYLAPPTPPAPPAASIILERPTPVEPTSPYALQAMLRTRLAAPPEAAEKTAHDVVMPASQADNSSARSAAPKTAETAVNAAPEAAALSANRLEISEPPESDFSYPVAPNSQLTGKVSLKAIIGTDGTVKEVDVVSGKRTLAAAAVEAVRHWRYRTYERQGNPVEAETEIVISFLGADAVSVSFPGK